jgi:hypothetical protein
MNDGRYALEPAGSIVVDRQQNGLSVRLHTASDVDATDLFIAISSTVEQRHEGVRSEIG